MSRWPGRLITKTPIAPSGSSAFDSAPGVWTLPEVAYWTKQGLWPNAANVGDPYFKYVSYLLGTTATNAAQNNTFLDSSTNNFTITRNGNTTQGTFSPYDTLWSNYFDGSGDYLATPSNAAFAYGTGDFTWEMWIFPTAANWTTGNYYLMDHGSNGGTLSYYQNVIRYYNSTTGTGSVLYTNGGTIPANQWTHVAVSRSGGTTSLFVNGALRASASDSYNYGTAAVTLANYGSGGLEFQGYMSNVRIVKGTAVYASAFTPPAAPLTAVSGASLLTCQSNRFRDASTNNFAITANGNTSVAAFNPFGQPAPGYSTSTYGGSAYFDGSGDYLTVPASSAWAFGTGDFTVECWVNFNSGSSNARISNRLPGGGASGTWGFNMGPNFFSFSEVVAGEPGVTASGLPSMTGAWTHLAACRSGSTLRLFANGVLVGSGTNTTNFNNTSYSLVIGATYETSMAGYISNVRIIKGTALYTAAFTPPTSPVTAVSGTSILCNFSNAGIYDASMNSDMETVGNVQVSTAQAKFGSTSIYFDGSGDVLSVPANPVFNFGTGDFTIECWLYPTASATVYLVGQAASNDYAPVLLYLTSGRPGIAVSPSNGTWSINAYVANPLTLNTWSHVAAVRNGNKWSIYVNGVENVLAASSAVTPYISTDPLGIGGEATGAPNYPYYGYIDDLRITRGYARYTTNFTPPSSAFFAF